MRRLLWLFLLLLAFVSYEVSARFSRLKTAVAPITKDDKTSLYTTALGYTIYLIDLDATFPWYDCVVHRPLKPCGLPECYLPIPCTNEACIQARSYVPKPSCPSIQNITAKYGCKVCAVNPFNPVSKSCAISQITENWLFVTGTNGRNTFGSVFLPSYMFSCAPSSLLSSLPKGAHGVAAFSRSPLSIPSQLSSSSLQHGANMFALCLPSSSSANGVVFIGDGPYFLIPSTNLDLRTLLSYAPLRNITSSPEYFMGLEAVLVDGKPTPVALRSASDMIKLSTIVPYTTLRTDIYKASIQGFSTAMKSFPRAKAVKPFTLCYKTGSVGFTRMRLRVPNIEFKLENGKKWTIHGSNSMKLVGNGVACLAFVDGGKTAEQAIVMGTYQLQDNFLLFDLEKSRLGFSSTLLSMGTSCSNFNFTEIKGIN